MPNYNAWFLEQKKIEPTSHREFLVDLSVASSINPV